MGAVPVSGCKRDLYASGIETGLRLCDRLGGRLGLIAVPMESPMAAHSVLGLLGMESTQRRVTDMRRAIERAVRWGQARHPRRVTVVRTRSDTVLLLDSDSVRMVADHAADEYMDMEAKA